MRTARQLTVSGGGVFCLGWGLSIGGVPTPWHCGKADPYF